MGLNFAIIGCGKIADRHAQHISVNGFLLGVCDIVKERADLLAEKYKCRSYYSLDDLLENEKKIDVVAICTPNGLHALHSIQCLEAGIHVLCEKPLAIKSQDAKAMINAAGRFGKNLFVVKQNRYNPPVAEVKKILDENKLGKIYSFQLNCFWNRPKQYYVDTWKGSKEMDGGTLFTQFSHFIDLLYWMLGDVAKVNAITKNFAHPQIEIEDTGMVIFEMKSGVLGTLNYTVNSYNKNMEGSFIIFGEKGTVKIGGQYLNELSYQNIQNYYSNTLPESAKVNDYGFYQGSMSNHDKVYENLLIALKQEKHTMAMAEDGLKTVEIIEMVYQAATAGTLL
jgi:UDP-N-acetyl-2-amino-2-deoxyglucuronate dehydrogenase